MNGEAIQVVTDTATVYPPPMRIEVEHGPPQDMRSFKNFRHGYYELGIKATTALQLVATSPFTGLVVAI